MNNAYDDFAADEKRKDSSPRGKGKGKASEIFMKTSAGRNKVRLLGDPKKVFTLWNNKKKQKHVVPVDLVEKLRDAKIEVREQIATNVFDRLDNETRLEAGKGMRVKILEKGPTVFKTIVTRYMEVADADGNKIHPGGPRACDWLIKVNVPDPDDLRTTEYNVINIDGQTNFSRDEIRFLARTPNQELIKELIKKDVIDKARETGYAEKHKDLPLGEKGLIDLDAFYDAEKHREALIEMLEDATGESSSGSKSILEDLDSDESEDVTDLDVSGSDEEEPEPVTADDLDDLIH